MTVLEIFQALFGFWPLITLAAFIGVFKGKGKFIVVLRRGLRLVFALWLLWALIGVSIVVTGARVATLIEEPWNTVGFVLVGVACGALLFYLEWRDWHRIHEALQNAQTIEDIYRLSPGEFEELVAEFFRRHGFKAQRVGAQGDHGVDLVIETPHKARWIVQCKRWKGQVGEPVIRDFYGAMMSESASKGFVVTTGTFSQAALAWAEGKPIELLDGEQLVKMVKEVRK
jgi:restriction system protein